MFQYTLAVLDKTVRDIKAVGKSISVITEIIYILYLSYAIITNIGTLWANIALLCASSLYLVFLIFYYAKLDKAKKKAKEGLAHAYRTVKLAVNGATLVIALYGIYVAASEVSAITVVFAGLSTIGWLFSLLLELTAYFVENRRALFAEAFKADTAEIKQTVTRPVTAVSDFIKKATGQKTEVAEQKPIKKKRVLDKLVYQRKERKAKERERQPRLAERKKVKSEAESIERRETVKK